MKTKVIQRSLGRDGKYRGVLQKEKRSFGSESSPSEMQSWFQNYFESNPKISGTIDSCEKSALKIIGDHGFDFREPYSFDDAYVIDQEGYYYFDCSGYTAKELAEATDSKPIALLCSVIEKVTDDSTWELQAIGRAANILIHCHHLRLSMDEADIENTAHNAMLLQQEIDHLKFMQWEYPARVGEKQLAAKNVAYTREVKDSWVVRYNQLTKESPSLSKRQAAMQIESETGHDAESIRKYI